MNPVDWYRDGRQYLTEVQAEYKKITWPPQKEAMVGTAAVIVIVAIVLLPPNGCGHRLPVEAGRQHDSCGKSMAVRSFSESHTGPMTIW